MVNIIKNFLASEARGETLLFLPLSLSRFVQIQYRKSVAFRFGYTRPQSVCTPLHHFSPLHELIFPLWLFILFAARVCCLVVCPKCDSFPFLCSILFGWWRQLCSRVLAPYAFCVRWRGEWESWGIDRSRVLKALPIVEYFTVFLLALCWRLPQVCSPAAAVIIAISLFLCPCRCLCYGSCSVLFPSSLLSVVAIVPVFSFSLTMTELRFLLAPF